MSAKASRQVENVGFVTSDVINGLEFEFLFSDGGLNFDEVIEVCEALGSTIALPNSIDQSESLFFRVVEVFEILGEGLDNLGIFIGNVFPLNSNSLLGLQDSNPEIVDADDISRFTPLVEDVDISYFQTPGVAPWNVGEPNNSSGIVAERCVE